MIDRPAFWFTLRTLALSLLLGLWPFAHAWADDSQRNIAVIYPDIGEPYRAVFSAIVDGIEDQAKGRITPIAVGSNANAQDITTELRRRDVRAIIALGRNGLKVASALDRQWGVVAGGVLSVPESQARDFSVHSLAPDPALLLARLKAIMPGAKRVIVVYDPRQNDWLIRLAQDAAKAQGLELLAYEVQDLKAAVRQYRDAMQAADPKKDVLWLPQDSSAVDEAVVLPMVLEESWSRGLVVFSSSVNHVRRGVLFSLYPDNAELGRMLGRAALVSATSGATASMHGVSPLKEVLLAVNTRTANHLGLNLDARRLRVDMVFPEP